MTAPSTNVVLTQIAVNYLDDTQSPKECVLSAGCVVMCQCLSMILTGRPALLSEIEFAEGHLTMKSAYFTHIMKEENSYNFELWGFVVRIRRISMRQTLVWVT